MSKDNIRPLLKTVAEELLDHVSSTVTVDCTPVVNDWNSDNPALRFATHFISKSWHNVSF